MVDQVSESDFQFPRNYDDDQPSLMARSRLKLWLQVQFMAVAGRAGGEAPEKSDSDGEKNANKAFSEVNWDVVCRVLHHFGQSHIIRYHQVLHTSN